MIRHIKPFLLTFSFLLLTATPIIFSTGMPESVAGLAKNLNVVILKKPVNPETLIAAAKKLLKMP